MQPNSTLKKIGGAFKYVPILLFIILCFFSGKINAQVYVNGNLSTGATAENGTVAPGGTTWSEVQHDAGNTTEANNTIGTSAAGTFSVADDFTVPTGQTWSLSKITVYGYVTGSAPTPSPFTFLRIRIHSSSPLAGPTTIVFGDLTTDRLSASVDALTYRISNTVVPGPLPTGTTRKVWALEANLSVILPAGTYWLEYQVSGGFMPLSTPLGARTLPGYNAIQSNAGVWAQMLDIGFPTTAPDVAVDMPFKINYSIPGACTGTPNPGTTNSSAATACPGINFNLSLQNAFPFTGITYQWQSSPDNVTYSNIAGATSASLSRNHTASTWYRCNVTCSGNTGTSTPVQVLVTPPSGCYCSSGATSTADEDIFNVTVGSMSNNSTCATIAPGPLSSQNLYSNYTSGTGAPAAPNVFAGASNPVSVTIGTCGGNFTNSVAIWIDYNQDGTFAPGERVYVSAAGAVGPHTETGLMNIPANATLGLTRMRVVNVETGTPTGILACGTYTWGETEDYNVNIVPCVQGVFTTVPANTSTACGSNASFTVAGTGSLLTFSWQFRVNATSAWQSVTNGGVYSGATTATLTLTNVPATMSGYQYRALMQGGCTAVDFSSPPATLTVTPLIATTNVSSATICTGSIQALTLTNASSPVTTSFSSGSISLPILDGNVTGINHTIPVSGIPAGAVVTNVSVTLNVPHTYVSDLEVVLKAPNGQIINLSDLVSGTNQAGANFTNTVISSSGTAALSSGIRPGYTGTFKADAIPGPTGAFGVPAGPTGFLPTTTSWANLYSVLNGNWTIAMYDAGPPDVGTLTNWVVTITYGAPTTGVWTSSPATPNTMFTDAAATVAYTAGSQATTIYVKPTANTSYSVVYTSPTPCVSGATVIPVTVANPVTGVVNPTSRGACLGNTATFSVSASGNPLTYQWQVSTTAVPAFTNISGATSASLALTGVTASMSGNQYRCVISSSPCTPPVTSGAATLTVNGLPTLTIAAPLLQLTPGLFTTITATTNNAAGASYSWTRNGVSIGGPGTNTRVATIDSIGTYRATVTDANGCVTTSNSLVIGTAASDRLWIYPNPTTGVFQVRYYYKTGDVLNERRVIQLYNSAGVAVVTKIFALDNTQSPYLKMDFDVSKLPSGIYIVKLLDQYQGSTIAGKLVVER